MRELTLLGSTGSIGTQTLDVVRQNPGRYRVAALTARSNIDILGRQIEEFSPDIVVVTDPCAASVLRKLYGSHVDVREGNEELAEVCALPNVDVVVTALVGFAGLVPTLTALRHGKRVALANKETLVVAGRMIQQLVVEHNAELIPVDSEHSAIHQCLSGEIPASIEEIILTASGGPFRLLARDEFDRVTPERALRHPNWTMGPKITIDSATLMNKGLEVIEARWLFDVDASRIRVVVHPQSIIHSMVQFVDGSVKAQLGLPDMRLPIQYALGWPERTPNDYDRLSLANVGTLSFEEPDHERFPCLGLAYRALERDGTAPAVLNAANEIAVEAFLAGSIPFTDIAALVERSLAHARIIDDPSIEDILEADKRTREELRSYLADLGKALPPTSQG